MEQMERFIQYMTEICEKERASPEGFAVTGETPEQRAEELRSLIAEKGVEAFVSACEEAEKAADPDRGKHAFEVLLDCVAQEDGMVLYLAEALKKNDRTSFYKLSQVTTHLDLDPEEFVYWLGHREDYSSDEEKACAVLMDACLERLKAEGRMEVAAALLAGDQKTFESFRCEAPELRQNPAATFDWYCKNYLDRDYPVRFFLKHNGVKFN